MRYLGTQHDGAVYRVRASTVDPETAERTTVGVFGPWSALQTAKAQRTEIKKRYGNWATGRIVLSIETASTWYEVTA